VRRLAVALAFAAVLALAALIKPTAPTLTTPVDLRALADVIKSDPALLAEAAAFLDQTHLNVTLPAPPSAAPTEMAIGANATAARAGSHVAVSGDLTSRGRPVAGALIAIYLQGRLAALAQTDARGVFNASVYISAYVPLANITAVYVPPPGSPYAPSSASIQLRVLFNATELALSAPAAVRWGDPLRIEIRQSPPVERQVVVALSNGTSTVVLRAVVRDEAVLEVPTAGLSPGNYTIKATAQPEGPWAPASASAQVAVAAAEPQISLRVPPVLVAGAPAPLEVYVEPKLAVATFLGGTPLGGYVPLEAPTGPAVVRAVARAAPPYASAQASAQVFVVNPMQVAVAAVALFVAARRLRPRRGGLEEVRREVAEAAGRGPLPEGAEAALGLLAEAFHVLGERAGVRYNRTMTYREYAARVGSYARDGGCLKKIVELAERSVYSPHAPTPQEISEARICAGRL
jgi:HAMP domain-containing protein